MPSWDSGISTRRARSDALYHPLMLPVRAAADIVALEGPGPGGYNA